MQPLSWAQWLQVTTHREQDPRLNLLTPRTLSPGELQATAFRLQNSSSPIWIPPPEHPPDFPLSFVSIKPSCFLFRRKVITKLERNNIHLKSLIQKAPWVTYRARQCPRQRSRLEVWKGYFLITAPGPPPSYSEKRSERVSSFRKPLCSVMWKHTLPKTT